MGIAASVVTYTVQGRHADELTERVRQHLTPAAREVPGYRGFLLLDMGDGKRLALLLFDTVDQARAAQQALTPIGEKHTYALMDGAAQGSLATAIIADGIFADAAQA
jgi:hypothetical protein